MKHPRCATPVIKVTETHILSSDEVVNLKGSLHACEHVVASERIYGNLKGKAIYLRGGFKWKIVTDDEGVQCLIALF